MADQENRGNSRKQTAEDVLDRILRQTSSKKLDELTPLMLKEMLNSDLDIIFDEPPAHHGSYLSRSERRAMEARQKKQNRIPRDATPVAPAAPEAKDPLRPPAGPPAGRDLLDVWRQSLGNALNSHTRQQSFWSPSSLENFTVEATNFSSWVDVTFQYQGKHLRGSFSLDHRTKKLGLMCQCGHRNLCEHTHLIVTELLKIVKTPGTPLEEGLLGKTLREREQEKTLNILKSFTAVVARNTEHYYERPGQETQQTPLLRYGWNLSWKPELKQASAALLPVEMQERKNGGWTKGRELSLDSFLGTDEANWSELDRKIASKINTSSSWQPTSLSVLEALELLADSDSFLLNKEPASISLEPLELFVNEVPDGFRLETTATRLLSAHPGAGQVQIGSTNRAVLIVLPSERRVVALKSPGDSAQITQHLKEHSFVPARAAEDLRQILLTLSSSMPVHLPPSMAPIEEQVPSRPALLMLLRPSGVLDISVVMRDPFELMDFPGEGQVRKVIQEKRGTVHYIRQTTEELRLARDLVTTLQLDQQQPTRDWSWRINQGDDISRILQTAGELVERGEVAVMWHKESASQLDVIGRVSAQNVRVSVARQRDWFGLDGTCTLGDREVPLKELLAAVQGRTMNGLIEVSPGKWASIADDIRRTLTRLADVSIETRGKLQLDASAAPVVSLLEKSEIQLKADKHWEKCLKRLQDATDLTLDPPADLNASLRDYQTEGFRWMSRLAHWGIGGILADDMGLGKTIQTLAVLLTRKDTGPALIIAPTSLGFNWQRECERFTPSLRPVLFRESDRPDLQNQVGNGDLVICSYGLALREVELLKNIEWGTLVLDEAQNIKNTNSKTAAAVRSIPANWKIALTGTPMENHLGELWSIFHTVAPGVLGPWEQFRRRFASPIEKDRNPDRQAALSRVIAPFVLRRSKAEVLRDLPARTESNLLVDLTPAERSRYDKMRLAAVTELDQIGGEELSHDQRFKILQILTRLRQLACHVGLVDESWKDSSSKLDLLLEQLQQLKERGSRPLIFSQFTSHLDLIRKACEKAGITFQYLDGQTTPSQRQERVEAFQRGEGDAFLISLKAGGTGLNLTAADYVIHMDPWWNPAVEDQATDRAHRIGQTKPVMVYRIIARGTIEEKILLMHGEKRDLVDSVLTGADTAARLSTQDLADLIRRGV